MDRGGVQTEGVSQYEIDSMKRIYLGVAFLGVMGLVFGLLIILNRAIGG